MVGAPTMAGAVERDLETHRPALAGHCYRMLGSVAEADDAVQETMLRAWKGIDRFQAHSSLSTWLHRIATNVCLDSLKHSSRRELPTLDGPSGSPEDELVARPGTHWLEPVPDAWCLSPTAEAERLIEQRQHLTLAFVAALQHLPASQRASLILKDVVGFSTAEIAETLELTPAAVNSALQRARRTMSERERGEPSPGALSDVQRELVRRYVDAFHDYDIERLVSLLHEDGTMSMPPFALWLQGRDDVAGFMLGPGAACRDSRLLPTEANGTAAFAHYKRTDGVYRAWSLITLDLGPTGIRSIIHFLDVETLFPRFGFELALAP